MENGEESVYNASALAWNTLVSLTTKVKDNILFIIMVLIIMLQAATAPSLVHNSQPKLGEF